MLDMGLSHKPQVSVLGHTHPPATGDYFRFRLSIQPASVTHDVRHDKPKYTPYPARLFQTSQESAPIALQEHKIKNDRRQTEISTK